MNLHRRKLLLILTSALTAVGLLWAFALRGDGPPESDTRGISESERAELSGRGIVVPPGARNVTRSEVGEGAVIMTYKLDGEFGRSEAEDVANSIITSLEGNGWEVLRRNDFFIGQETVILEFRLVNRGGTLVVSYLLQYSTESAQSSTSTELGFQVYSGRRGRDTPTPSP